MIDSEAQRSVDADSYSYSVADGRVGRADAHLAGRRWRTYLGAYLKGP